LSFEGLGLRQGKRSGFGMIPIGFDAEGLGRNLEQVVEILMAVWTASSAAGSRAGTDNEQLPLRL
jgi:hypothetical protein